MVKYQTIEDAFDALVPAMGQALTVRGEIVRAYNRLMYRCWNDGDVPGVGYGNETCNSPARYLKKIVVHKFIEHNPKISLFLKSERSYSYTYGDISKVVLTTNQEDDFSQDWWDEFSKVILGLINDDQYESQLESANVTDSISDLCEEWDYDYDEDDDNEDGDY